jgi:hypothetical protein
MIDTLPEGQSIGWMQAPLQWILTHTVRFVGIVRVVILDGEGFILIRKGKPLVYFFKHGRIELRGHGALDYFNSHKTIEFKLCRYTPEEFSRALKICEVEELPQETVGVKGNVPSAPAHAEGGGKTMVESPMTSRPEQPPPVLPPKSEPEREKSMVESPMTSRPEQPPPVLPPKSEPEREKSMVELPVTSRPEQPPPVLPPKSEPEREKSMVESPMTSRPEQPPPVLPPKSEPKREKSMAAVPPKPEAVITTKSLVPEPGVLEEADIKIIGQIKKLNGIIAISVFNDDRNILLTGDVDIEPLLKIARTMLATVNTISPHLDWGSFVHMTLQIPEGNLIIAPYHENHLCILTTRTINIGHIRRILRDLQQYSDRDIVR